MGLLISSNAQANYNLAKSSLDEIHHDAQIELNKAIESGKKARPNLAKLTPFYPIFLMVLKILIH
ncbi:hypothetical protein JO83_09960 [Avibacterium paragallinarum]|nr:hypothetical protein JO83_09960 [Avibacterium paragallinarum]